MSEAPKITRVYSFPNGMCMVFDQYGRQMPEFQGRTDECKPKIAAAGFVSEMVQGVWNPAAARALARD